MTGSREASPDEWARMLLSGQKLTAAELATSLRAAIERGARTEREVCARLAEECAGDTLPPACAAYVAAEIRARSNQRGRTK